MSLEPDQESKRLGIVISGSLSKGVEVKLDSSASVEDMSVGHWVTVEGERRRFFGMITDISLGVADPQLTINPPDVSDPFIAEVVSGITVYGNLHVVLQVSLSGDEASLLQGPQPVKTVPAHFSVVRTASQRDVELVFGQEGRERFFIGTPLDMETKVCLNLPEFVKRSNGVFGKSGTGKTFFTRLLLIGMLQNASAVNLIFDMHNEYGWSGVSESGHSVKGLKQLGFSNVALFTLDEQSAKRRKVSTDFVVKIGYDEIEPKDIEILHQTLNLTEASVQAVYQLTKEFGEKSWLGKTIALKPSKDTEDKDKDSLKDLLGRLNIHESTYQNLRRGLEKLIRLSFLVPHAPENAVQKILGYLNSGTNVVLEFGSYIHSDAAQVLVANLLSRRIYEQYQRLTEQAQGEGGKSPTHLVIAIEEAHKLLNPEVSQQTIFGTIAREMRKFNVTLLLIDQRPSGIDQEVMSQLGTKIAFFLDNERDIDSVLAGVSGHNELRSVLSKLETKQQFLIFGHAVPMPAVLRTRDYGSTESYRELGLAGTAELKRKAEQDAKLWDI
jgi:hypothetical protein